MSANENVNLSELRSTVSDSFQIFQATVTMASIFLGFVFAGIIQYSTKATPLSSAEKVVLHLLVAALVFLFSGLLAFHYTAHQIIAYWKIFWPDTTVRLVGGLLFTLDITGMLLATAIMLWSSGLRIDASFCILAGLLQVPFVFLLRRLHRGAPYAEDIAGSK